MSTIDIERLLSIRAYSYLETLIRIYGIVAFLHRKVTNAYSNVYGIESGQIQKEKEKIKVLITRDKFVVTDRASGSWLDSGWLFTNACVSSGDAIEIDRSDMKSKKFKITDIQTIGMTTTIFTRFKIVAIA